MTPQRPEMTFTEYLMFTRTTAIYREKLTQPSEALLYLALGLSGEVGEISEKLKKIIRSRGMSALAEPDGEERAALLKEAGDVLWYLARFVDELGGSFQTVAETNRAKLQDRKERGVLHGSGDNR